MSALKKRRRRTSLVVKRGWLRGVIEVRDHEFWVAVPRHGIEEVWPLRPKNQ